MTNIMAIPAITRFGETALATPPTSGPSWTCSSNMMVPPHLWLPAGGAHWLYHSPSLRQWHPDSQQVGPFQLLPPHWPNAAEQVPSVPWTTALVVVMRPWSFGG